VATIQGERFLTARKYREAKESFEEALIHHESNIVRRHLADAEGALEGEERRVTVESLINEGRLREAMGDFDGALAAYQKASELTDTSVIDPLIEATKTARERTLRQKECDRLLSEARNAMASSDWEIAVKVFEDALGACPGEVVKEPLAEARFQLALKHRRVAQDARDAKVWPEASRYYGLAIDQLLKAKELGRAEYQELGVCYYNIGRLHQDQKQFAPALEWYQKAVEAKEGALAGGEGNRHSLGVTYHQIGRLHQDQKQFAPALEWYQKAVEAKEGALAGGEGDEYSLSLTYYQMSMCHERMNNLAQAIQFMEKDAEILQRIGHEELQQDKARLENLKWRRNPRES
jgi:tetratricopeptide (TPR) repeat protein